MQTTSPLRRAVAILICFAAILALASCDLLGKAPESTTTTTATTTAATTAPAATRRVLLISIDGLRADAVMNTEGGRALSERAAYSTAVTTVMPSVTLPCHMSMFHSVPPAIHGVGTNTYTPSATLGRGITEAVAESGKTAAIFYNWQPMGAITTAAAGALSTYIGGETNGWEEANTMIGDACIAHLADDPADFVYLYLGFLDEWGHKYGWLSDEYYDALDKSLSLVERVIAALPEGYTVIITSDHGGHDYGHGSDLAEDMTIPLFILGGGYAAGRDLGPRSILDVAPTVAELMGIAAPAEWQGTPIR